MKCENKKCGVSFLGVEKWYYCCKKCGRSMPRNFPVELEMRNKARSNARIYKILTTMHIFYFVLSFSLIILIPANMFFITKKYFFSGESNLKILHTFPFHYEYVVILLVWTTHSIDRNRFLMVNILAGSLPETFKDILNALIWLTLSGMLVYAVYKLSFLDTKNALLQKYAGNARKSSAVRLYISNIKLFFTGIYLYVVIDNLTNIVRKWFLRKMHSGDRRMGL